MVVTAFFEEKDSQNLRMEGCLVKHEKKKKTKLHVGRRKSVLYERKSENGSIPRRFQGLQQPRQIKQLGFQAKEFNFMLCFFGQHFPPFLSAILCVCV